VGEVSREENRNSNRISDVARTRIECEQRTALLKKGRELEDTRVARENASIEWKLFRNRAEDAGVGRRTAQDYVEFGLGARLLENCKQHFKRPVATRLSRSE
jgi:hypothetical protein